MTTQVSVRSLDIAAIRSEFPALAEGLVLLDAPGGTQFPRRVADAISGAMSQALSNDHGAFASSRRSEDLVDGARQAVADVVGGTPDGVVLGPNMTTLTRRFAATLAKRWSPGDEIVVTRLDHDANVRPWVQAAGRAGVTVRWADVDPETCELPADQYDTLIGARTRLVAVTGASNAVGTKPAVRAIADRAHAAGALVYVDGVHLTAHAPVDMRALGADFYACSPYKFCGPHLGSVTADPQLLEDLDPDRLAPAPDTVPGKFEWGTPPFEMYAGLIQTAEFLADLLAGAGGTRRDRIVASMTALQAHESLLGQAIRDGLGEIPGVRQFGHAQDRTPTVAFRIRDLHPADCAAELGRRGICVWDGDFYAYEVVRRLGLADSGGLLRVGVAPYNDEQDVAALLGAVEQLARH